jgi:hypothetical protein
MRYAALVVAGLLLAQETYGQGVDFKLDTSVTFYGDNTEFTIHFAPARLRSACSGRWLEKSAPATGSRCASVHLAIRSLDRRADLMKLGR